MTTALVTKPAGAMGGPACLDDARAGGGERPPPALPNMLRLTYAPKQSGKLQSLPPNDSRVFYGRTLVPVDQVVELVIADSNVLEIKAVDQAPPALKSLQIPK
jgi:hypothetical protein